MAKKQVIKTAGIREFRAKLSRYVRDVEHGEMIQVTAHGEVVACLVSPDQLAEVTLLTREERERRQLLADGLVSRLGTQDEGDWPEPKDRGVRRGEAQAALDADRGDRV